MSWGFGEGAPTEEEILAAHPVAAQYRARCRTATQLERAALGLPPPRGCTRTDCDLTPRDCPGCPLNEEGR